MNCWKFFIFCTNFESITFIKMFPLRQINGSILLIFYNFAFLPLQVIITMALSYNKFFQKLILTKYSFNYGEISKVMLGFFYALRLSVLIFPILVIVLNFTHRKQSIKLVRVLKKYAVKVSQNFKTFSDTKYEIVVNLVFLFCSTTFMRIFLWFFTFQVRIDSFIFVMISNPLENVLNIIIVVTICFIKFTTDAYKSIKDQLEKKQSHLSQVESEVVFNQIRILSRISTLFYKSFGLQFSISLCVLLLETIGRVSFS